MKLPFSFSFFLGGGCDGDEVIRGLYYSALHVASLSETSIYLLLPLLGLDGMCVCGWIVSQAAGLEFGDVCM